MSSNIKFYKLKLIKQFLELATSEKKTLLDELVINATDPTIYERRIKMLQHLTEYETQIIKKIQQFETDDVKDLKIDNLLNGLKSVINRSA